MMAGFCWDSVCANWKYLARRRRNGDGLEAALEAKAHLLEPLDRRACAETVRNCVRCMIRCRCGVPVGDCGCGEVEEAAGMSSAEGGRAARDAGRDGVARSGVETVTRGESGT